MTNIPFPNPHDSDALNDYLDDLAAGKQTNPESDVEMAASAFHQLASRAEVSPPTQQSIEIEQARGEETMHTATLAAPVSNRTRRQMKAVEKKPSKSYGWLSAVIVAGLMISMIGSVWLNREPGNPNENLLWAPGTATAVGEDEVLTPESHSWIADFDPADCTETSGLANVSIDYQAMLAVEPQSYGIVGLADSSDANAASEQYRAMRACSQLTDAWAYWTDARINEHTRVINDQNLTELAELQEHYAANYPNQFMVIMNDLTIRPEIEAEWAARKNAGVIGQPIPLEAKLNPEFAVELSDGRIAFPATNIYAFEDPAIEAQGFPTENPASTVVMIFAMEDGSWKYDDSLALCLMNCENGVGNPLDATEADWAQSAESRTCTRQPMNPDVQRFDSRTVGDIDYTSRQYKPMGPTDSDNAANAADIVTRWTSCGALTGEISNETNSYMTPLGLTNLNLLANSGTGDPFSSAPYLRQWETGSSNLVSSTSVWNQIVVLDEPVRTTFGAMRWELMIDGSAPNLATVRPKQQGFSPEAATELADGRITIFAVPTISIQDRGAVTYEGNLTQQQIVGVTLQQHDDQWLVDELVMVDSGVILHGESDAWWWDESFSNLEATPWTQPVSFQECPEDTKLNRYDPDNPAGTLYTQEDYEQVSSDRSYEIVGPADPEDADAIVTRTRESAGCSAQGRQVTLMSTARYEYETRTTAGRESLDAQSEHREEGSATISDWFATDQGVTQQSIYIYQDPNELTVPENTSLRTQPLFNPEMTVQFADGRVGVLRVFVSYEGWSDEENEAIDSSEGFGINMLIFTQQNGEWMIDESLPICIGDCSDLPEGTPMPAVDPWATPVATPQPAEPTPTGIPRGGDNRG